MEEQVPKFDINGSKYDLSTFIGRVKQSYSNTDFRTLFTTDEEIKQANELLIQYKQGELPKGVTDSQLWDAKKVVDSTLHPDTNEKVFPLFRFSAFAPVNVVITTVMLWPSNIASFGRTAVIHAMNQTYNASVNYANRNATSEVDDTKLMHGFAGAVTSSVSIALGAAALMRRANAVNNPRLKVLVRSTLPFLAVSSAGCVNVLLMRREEMTKGIHVFDEDGVERGLSTVAGTNALTKCCAARVFWTIPGMIAPPLIMAGLTKHLPKNPKMILAAEVVVIAMCLWAGVPPALAIFPQQDSMATADMEEKFSNLYTNDGKKVERLYYNKGL